MGNKHAAASAALYEAADSGDIRVIRRLLRKGAKCNAVEGEVTLHWRCSICFTGVFQQVWTALMAACFKGHATVAECLIQAGCNVDARAEDGQTALHMAAFQGHNSIVEELLR